MHAGLLKFYATLTIYRLNFSLPILFTNHYPGLLLIRANFFQKTEFQDPRYPINRRAIPRNEWNNLSASNSLDLIYDLRCTGIFHWPLGYRPNQDKYPRSLGACSHLRNCIPTRHIVKLSSLSLFLLSQERGGRERERGRRG